MVEFILAFSIYLIPIATVVFFAISLVLFIVGRRRNKKVPGSIGRKRLTRDKILLIVSSVLLGVEATMAAVIMIVLTQAIAYM